MTDAPLHAHLALDGSAAAERESLKEARGGATPVTANGDATGRKSGPMVEGSAARGRNRPWDPRDDREARRAAGGSEKFLIARRNQLPVVDHVSARARPSK